MTKIYEELKKIADNYNIKIYDDFIGEKTFIWRISRQNEVLIMPARDMDIQKKIELLLTELKNLNLENSFIMPNIRELIENYNKDSYENLDEEKKIYCEVCGKEIDEKISNKTSMLQICNLCLRMQIRHNIDYLNCTKKTMGRYCLDCPVKIFKNCTIAQKKIQPEKFQNSDNNDEVEKTNINISKVNRINKNENLILSNDKNFVRRT